MGLKVINLMKQVPVPSQMRMGEDGLMDRTKAKSIINIDCGFGLEQGLEIKDQVKDAELLVVSMGPPSFEQSLKKAVAMGFDRALLLSDRRLGGSDTFATGLAIAGLLKKFGFERGGKEPFIIFAGRQTSDGDTAHVPSQVAENLGIPQVTFVEKVEYKGDHVVVRRIIEGGYQVLRVPIPCMISVTPTATAPRRPTLSGAMRAKAAKVEVWNLDTLAVPLDQIGINGSPTIVAKVVDIGHDRPAVTMISGETHEETVEKFVKEVVGVKQAATKAPVAAAPQAASTSVPADYPKVDFREGASGVLTWVEMHGNTPARSSLEILSPARKLAKELNTKVKSVVLGSKIKGIANEIIAYGADEVIIVDDPRLAEYRNLPFASVLSQIIKAERPEIALFGATTSGRELAPRIASRVGAGVTADCTSLEMGQYIHRIKKQILAPCLQSIRPTYGESKLATIIGLRTPQMSTARPGTFEVPAKDSKRKGIVKEFAPKFSPDDFSVEIIETKREEGGAQNLFTADIIIGGGRDCGELDNFALVKELTEALREQGINAEWGASRQAVDNGYAPYAHQVGQTGKTVRPKIYVAVAISGAIQHLAGMKESGKIIAINSDPQANIFHHADYGVARDYRDVLPLLIQRVKEGFTFGLPKK